MNRILLGALCAGVLMLAGCGARSQMLPAASPLQGAEPAAMSDFQQGLARGDFAPSCATAAAGEMRCFAYALTDRGIAEARAREAASGERTISSTSVSGFGPVQLQEAYATTTLAKSGGTNRVVAIVDAYDNPNLESDLAVYRAEFGLPVCTTANGCFKKVGEAGTSKLPAQNASWGQETSLDVDMVSANCPKCKILIVEATSASTSDLATSVNEAVKLGAIAVSNSYGGSESKSDPTYASYYNHAGVAITASNGDEGYGTQNPASFGTVTAVGGTVLSTAKNARGWTETVWSGSGSGCSLYEAKPSWQKDAKCAKRMVGDVAYVGDPYTGVAVYDSFPVSGQKGWFIFGGTSVGAPAIAAIYGLAGNTVSNAERAYTVPSGMNDVTSGSNGKCTYGYFCTAGTGYDGPSGMGTPKGTISF